MSHGFQLITYLQLLTREDTVAKEMSVIDEPAHVSVGLQLLEMSSITTPNQTISNVCTFLILVHFSKSSFLGKILAILPICNNEKN